MQKRTRIETSDVVRSARAIALILALITFFLPWGVESSNRTGHMVHTPIPGLAVLMLIALLSAGTLALPLGVPLALRVLVLIFPASRPAVWLYRASLVMEIAVSIPLGLLLHADRSVPLESRLPYSYGLLLWLLSLLVAAGFEVHAITIERRYARGGTTDRAEELSPMVPQGGRLACLLNLWAVVAAGLLLLMTGIALEGVGVSWDLHLYLTAAVTCAGAAPLYVWALVLALHGRHSAPAPVRSLLGAEATHAVAQLGAVVSLLVLRSPFTGLGAPPFAPATGFVLMAVLWGSLLVVAAFFWIVPRRGRLVAFLLVLLGLMVVARPYPDSGRSPASILQSTFLVGWGAMQVLSLVGWSRARRGGTRASGTLYLALVPPAAATFGLVIGLAVISGTFTFRLRF